MDKMLATKLVSIFCVAIMLAIGYHVVISNSKGETSSDKLDLVPANNWLSNETRPLTIGSGGAISSPSLDRSTSGAINLVWVQRGPDGYNVMWKLSADDCQSFSPDQTISPSFNEIRNLRIDCSGRDESIAISFETEKGICLILSTDGKNWGSPYQVDEGINPQIQVLGKNVILAYQKSLHGESYFVIAKLNISGGSIVNGTALLALPSEGPFAIQTLGNSLAYAVTIETPARAIVYGRMGGDGKTWQSPTLVSRLGKETISSIDMCAPFSISLTPSYVLSVATSSNGGSGGPGTGYQNDRWVIAFATFSCIAGILATFSSLFAWIEGGFGLKLYGIGGVVAGCIGTIIGFYSPFASNLENLTAFLGIWFGLMAIGFSALDLREGSASSLVKAFDMGAILIGVAAIGLGLLSLSHSRS